MKAPTGTGASGELNQKAVAAMKSKTQTTCWLRRSVACFGNGRIYMGRGYPGKG